MSGRSSYSVVSRIKVGLSAGLLLCCSRWIRAASGGSGATFLDIPVGAGPAALGSAYSALANDAYAPVWNPAGLGFLSSPQIAAQYLNYIESTSDEFFSAVYPFSRNIGGIGFSAQYFGSGSIDATDGNANSLGTYSDNFGAYSLAYGRSLTDKLSLGVTGKIIHENLDNVTATAYGAELGSLYKLNDQISLAGVVDNIGSKVTFLSDGDSLPLNFRLGGAYQPNKTWLVSAEGYIPESGPAGFRVGGQWRPIDVVSLRAGYRTDTTSNLSALAGFSTGIGLTWWGQEFSYAWVPYGDLGNTNYFSLVLKFGQAGENEKNLSEDKEARQTRSARALSPSPVDPETQQLMQILNSGQTPQK